MIQESRTVELARGDERLVGHLTYGAGTESDAAPHSLVLEVGGERFERAGEDVFDCLLSIRQELEERGMQIHVNGACVDVWPSPMSRSMGGGRRAYRMTFGQQALTKDLVDIFDMAEDGRLGTISEQTQYRADWFKSLDL